MNNIKIPYGVASYEEIREENYFYIDKTKYIVELESFKNPVFLRPRRFGKTLLCTTLSSYYDINKKHQFEELFGDTWIGKNPTPLQGTYMVLHLDFSIVYATVNSAEVLARNFDRVIRPYFTSFVDSEYSEYFKNFSYNDGDTTWDLLSKITKFVKANNLPPLYIIIDEYDNFTNQLITTNRDSLYMDILSGDGFLKTFFKIIKAGQAKRAIERVFITGVLPITIDDLTSGYNIAEVVTLEENLVSMLGFTHVEAKQYLTAIFEANHYDKEIMPEIWQLLINNYDGYRFLPDAEPLFNATILTYFFKRYSLNNAKIPMELIDENLRTDVNWIKRLVGGTENAREILFDLVNGQEMSYTLGTLRSKFNKEQFFDKDFYPISFYYLGMTTLADGFSMKLPNNTMVSIFADYYNDVCKLSSGKDVYAPLFKKFYNDFNIEALFAGYYEHYLGQFVGQSFDKINETFVRNTFYELCNRYITSYFTIAIEQNYPSGRSDFEITGRDQTAYFRHKHIVEFKYTKGEDWKKVQAIEAPLQEDVEQLNAYAQDALKVHSSYKIQKHIFYIAGNKGFKHFALND